MPTDEEHAQLARTFPALRSRPIVSEAVARDPGLIDTTPRLPDPMTDDRPLTDKFPALKDGRDPNVAKAIERQGGLVPAYNTPTTTEEA